VNAQTALESHAPHGAIPFQLWTCALGWRIFEDYLVEAGGLGDVPLETLREELARSARRLGWAPRPGPRRRPPGTRGLIQPVALPGTPALPSVGTFGPGRLRTWGDVQQTTVQISDLAAAPPGLRARGQIPGRRRIQ